MNPKTQDKNFQPVEAYDYIAGREAVTKAMVAARRPVRRLPESVATETETPTSTCRDYPVYGCERCDV